jgi:DNA repair protein RadD
MQLRYYQDEAIEHTFDFIRNNPGAHPLIELPTGSGKSLVLAGIVSRALYRWKGTRVMMLTHSKTLVEQNAEKMRSILPDVDMGIYSAGLRKKQLGHAVTFAGIDSVADKPHLFGKQNLIIVDEAHMVDWCGKTRYRKFIGGMLEINPKLRVIGLTATPWRVGVGHIATPQEGPAGDRILFSGVSYSKLGVQDFHEFVEQGYLAPLHPLRTDLTLDVSGVGVTGGDFNQGQLQDAVDREELTKAAIAESKVLAAECKHWFVFCTGVSHVEHTVKFLNEAGISAVGVHSNQPDTVNDENIRKAKSGEVMALVNMGVLTTGFDWPEADYGLILRPTKSAPLWGQILGRFTRPAPWAGKKYALIGDFAGNTRRLGPINDPVIPRPKGKGGGGVAPIKTCEAIIDGKKCNTENHTSAVICQKCGVAFPPPKPKMTQYADTSKLMRDADDGNPVIEVLRVNSVSYQLHKKFGKPDSIKVTYTCGYRMFNEFVMLEHDGYPAIKAKNWWKRRFEGSVPATTGEALDVVHLAAVPNHIRVHTNLKYPDIKDHCFNRTAFGTIDPMEFDGDEAEAIQKPRISLGADPWALRPEGIVTELPGVQPHVVQPSDAIVFDDDDVPF